MSNKRNIVWFSCGAASAVTAKLISKQIPDCVIAYCNTGSEDDDNKRFLNDVENWIDKKIIVLKSEKYSSVKDVIEKTGFIRNKFGARCTTELKRNVRLEFANINDVNYYGFTADEPTRILNWRARNPKTIDIFPLQQYGITKDMCYGIIDEAGIKLPKMYIEMGLNHNNCICCLKATSATYWNIMRKQYPQDFTWLANKSKKLKFKMVYWKGTYIFLDELPETATGLNDIDISCDLGCQMIYNTYINE